MDVDNLVSQSELSKRKQREPVARSQVRIVLVSSRIGYREVPCDISANHRVQQFDTKTLLNHTKFTCFRDEPLEKLWGVGRGIFEP